MQIRNSIEWSRIETELSFKAKHLAHGHEVQKMIDNIQKKITILSKAEVEVRRGKKHAADIILKEVNDDIETVEGFLLVAALLG